MFYDYAELEDGTQIAYSNKLEDNTVEISIERPIDSGFNSARCLLPSLSWLSVEGFSEGELSQLGKFIERNAPFILRLAQEASKTCSGDRLDMEFDGNQTLIESRREHTLEARLTSWDGNRFETSEFDWGELAEKELRQ